MNTYEVIVETTHAERYYVEAESEEEARRIWSGFPMEFQECLYVEGITSVTLLEDDE